MTNEEYLRTEREALRFLTYAWEQFTHADPPVCPGPNDVTVGQWLCKFARWLNSEGSDEVDEWHARCLSGK